MMSAETSHNTLTIRAMLASLRPRWVVTVAHIIILTGTNALCAATLTTDVAFGQPRVAHALDARFIITLDTVMSGVVVIVIIILGAIDTPATARIPCSVAHCPLISALGRVILTDFATSILSISGARMLTSVPILTTAQTAPVNVPCMPVAAVAFTIMTPYVAFAVASILLIMIIIIMVVILIPATVGHRRRNSPKRFGGNL
jgi:hypothetical protein